MLKEAINRDIFQSLTKEQAADLKYSFMNIKGIADSLESERLEGMNLTSTMNLLSSRISSITHDVSTSLDNPPNRMDGIRHLLGEIRTLANLMAFLSSVHDDIRLLKDYVNDANDLLTQKNTERGLSW